MKLGFLLYFLIFKCSLKISFIQIQNLKLFKLQDLNHKQSKMNRFISLVFIIQALMIVSGNLEYFNRHSGFHNETAILMCRYGNQPEEIVWYHVQGDRFTEFSTGLTDYLKVIVNCERLKIFACQYTDFNIYKNSFFTVQCHDNGLKKYSKSKFDTNRSILRNKNKKG